MSDSQYSYVSSSSVTWAISTSSGLRIGRQGVRHGRKQPLLDEVFGLRRKFCWQEPGGQLAYRVKSERGHVDLW